MKLCVALDRESREANLELARELKGLDLWLKVGFRGFIRDGRSFLEELKRIGGFNIFLDLKLYDIPNTMADAAGEIAAMGVEMFNVHASAGKAAMQAVMERLEKRGGSRPLVLAVTALTSFDEAGFRSVYNAPLGKSAGKMAWNSYEAGLDGVVCSVHESRAIKDTTAPEFLTLTPGIRPAGSDAGDQVRVATPQTAKEELVDFIVVGRPIYKAPDPAAAAREILASI